MNPILFPAFLLASITTFAHCETIDNLDLRLISQLRFELRNIPQLEDQCQAFWHGLLDKLDQESSRDVALRQLAMRLKGLKNFEKLAAFVDNCISHKDAPSSPIDKSIGTVKILNAKVEQLEKELRNKDEEIRQLTLDNQQLKISSEQSQRAKAADGECSRVFKEQLETVQNEMEKLKVELKAKDDKVQRMRQAKEAAIEKLNELAQTLGRHASQLVQDKDFAEQQARDLRNSLTNTIKDYDIMLKAKQEQVDNLSAKVKYLEHELYSTELELDKMRENLNERWRPNSNEVQDRNGRRVIKIQVH